MKCPRARYVLHSTNVGPPPERARSTAAPTASYTANASNPSTIADGMPYPSARIATSLIFIVSAVDVVDAYWLFSSTKIAGRFHTAHKLRFSWNGPRLVAPSPKKQTAT